MTDPLKPTDESRAASTSRDGDKRQPKRRYSPPVLVEYGPVGKLTRAGSATIGDAGAMMMACL